MIITLIFLKYNTQRIEPVSRLECNNGVVTIIAQHNQITLIDPGVIGRRLSASSWCEYKLMPHLAKTYGTTTIDHFIIMQPNKIIFDALSDLIEKITIHHMCIPLWEGKIPQHWWNSYARFRRKCMQHEIKISYLGAQSYTLNLGAQNQLIITPLQDRIKLENCSYAILDLEGKIEGLNLKVFSAKHKKTTPNMQKTL